jgi:formamidopyrimidine-DNA glycosylase
MPELPEVESARRRAARALEGHRIERVFTADDPIVYEGVSPRRFAAALRGRLVRAIHRKGKHLWMALDERPYPLFHFGMTGSFELYRREADRPRFCKVEILMENGIRLAMPDARRFGRLRLRHEPEDEPPLSDLGFDPLHGLPAVPELHRLLSRRRAPLKAVLLDQSLFAGVGNWIADEVLFQARLRPDREASGLRPQETARLRARMLAIIKRAVAVDADSDLFPRSWLFHHRWGRNAAARTAAGEKISHATIGGRTTAWVPSRQR